MIQREIVVTLPGTAAPKGSLKCIGARGARGHVLIEDNDRTKPWRDKIAAVVRTRVTQHAEKRQPLTVEITTSMVRPDSHYGTGRNSKQLKPAAPRYPTGHNTGDVDKLARLVLDALQDAGLIPDDAQVVELVSRKVYTTSAHPDAVGYPGQRIRIYPTD